MANTEQLLKKINSYKKDCIEKCLDIRALIALKMNASPQEAVYWCLQGLTISRKIGYSDGESFNDSIGIANVYAGNFFDALKYFNVALQYYEQKLKNNLALSDRIATEVNASKVKNNIAIVYENLGLHTEAMQVHEKNLDYYLEQGLHRDALLSFLNITSVAVSSHNYDRAIKTTKEFFSYYKKHKINEPVFWGMAYVNRLAASNNLLPVSQQSAAGYFKAIKVFQKAGNLRFVRLVYINLAEYYQAANNSAKMVEYALKAIEAGKNTSFNEQQDKLYHMLYNYYKQQKDLPNAFQYLELLNKEKETQKKQEATLLILSKNITEQINQNEIAAFNAKSPTVYFSNTDSLQIHVGSKIHTLQILDIASIGIDKNGLTTVETIHGILYKTTMVFSSLMAKINQSNHHKSFFYTHKRNQAINLIYLTEIDKRTRTVTISFNTKIKKIQLTARQYYQLSKLKRS